MAKCLLCKTFLEPDPGMPFPRTCATCLENHEAKRRLVDELRAKPCTDCKRDYPCYIMQFDHLPGYPKVANISVMVQRRRYTMAMLREELRKCELVCANCHRIRTYTRSVVWQVARNPSSRIPAES